MYLKSWSQSQFPRNARAACIKTDDVNHVGLGNATARQYGPVRFAWGTSLLNEFGRIPREGGLILALY